VIDVALAANGRFVESTDVDNGLATATVAAIGSVRHFLAWIEADYSAAPAAAFKLIQVKLGTTVIKNIRWNAALEMPLRVPLPLWPHSGLGEQLSVELAASGTGGVTGRVGVVVASV
jgi:hypothetical protein